MSIFNNPTFKDIIQYQLAGIRSLDRESISRLYEPLLKVENQLRIDLDRYSGSQFTYKKKQRTLTAIRKQLILMEQILEQRSEEDAGKYFNFGNELANEEVSSYNKIFTGVTYDLPKQRVAVKQNEFLINNMKQSLRTYSAGIRAQVSNALTQAVLAGASGYEVTAKISQFLQIKKWRIVRIVRTEQHRIFNAAKLLTYNKFKETRFSDLYKRMGHPMDHRTAEDSKQLKRLDPIVPLNKPFVFVYKRRLANGQMRKTVQTGMVPPLRPNDRAYLIPWRKKWKED